MSDKKISQLPASTTPLAGTEVLAVVQSGDTKKVSVANLTAGRAVGMASLDVSSSVAGAVSLIFNTDTADGNGVYVKAGGGNVGKYNMVLQNAAGQDLLIVYADGSVQTGIGNLVIGTSGKGIDFSADGSAAGMTSELLDDYEEGTWTPTVVGGTTAGSQSYVWQKGTYTKIGNRVFIDFEILVGTKDATTAGSIAITGLPFVANVNSGIPLGFVVLAQNGVTFSGADNTLVAEVVQGGSIMNIATYPSTNPLAASALASSFRIFGTTQYYV